MGHDYVGVAEQAGRKVTNIKPGDFVIGSFYASDNTCEICQAGYQSRCAHLEGYRAMDERRAIKTLLRP